MKTNGKVSTGRLAVVGIVLLCIVVIIASIFPTPVTIRGGHFLSIGTGEIVLASPGWLSGWDNRCEIIVDAGDIDSGLTWFPVTLHLGTSVGIGSDDVSFIFDEVGNNYQKIAITDSDGDELYAQVESWNATSEQAVVHVSRPDWVAASATNSTLYFYYDNDHADNTEFIIDQDETYASEQINTSGLDMSRFTVKIGEDKIIYFYSQNNGGLSKIVKAAYNLTTKSWGSQSDVYVDGTYGCGCIAGGMIGTDIYVFFNKQVQETGESVSLGYIKSTDGGDNWSSYVDLTSQTSEDIFGPYGALVPTSTAGTYLQTWYEFDDGTPIYKTKAFKTTDWGSNWTTSVTVYSGTTEMCEACVAYCGNSTLIALLRLEGGDYVYQTQSIDDGASWGTNDSDYDDGNVAATNMGIASGIKIPWIIYDDATDKVIAVYADRGDWKIKLSEVDKDTVLGNETSWPTVTELASGFGSSGCSAGYPSIIKTDTGQFFFMYCKYITSSDYDSWGGYYPRRAVWDDDYLGVYHLADDDSDTSVVDSTSNDNDATKAGNDEPTQAAGKIGYCQDFDGDNDLITLPSGVGLDTDGTVECWFDADTLVDYPYLWVDRQDGSNVIRILWITDDDNLYAYGYDNAAYQFRLNTAFNDTASWHQAQLTFQDNDADFWLDGSSVETDSSVNMDAFTHSEVEIGSYGTTGSYADRWDGQIDEFRISGVRRNSAWLKASYESGRDDLLDWGGEEGINPEITNTPSSNNFGILAVNSTSSTAINYFEVENTGNCDVDVVIHGTDATGGDDTWTLSDTATPGENIYGLKCGLDDDDDTFDIIVRKTETYNYIVEDLVEDATQDWGLQLIMPSSLSGYDSNNMTATITLVASEAS